MNEGFPTLPVTPDSGAETHDKPVSSLSVGEKVRRGQVECTITSMRTLAGAEISIHFSDGTSAILEKEDTLDVIL